MVYCREIVATIVQITPQVSKISNVPYYTCKLSTGNFITISDVSGPALLILRNELAHFGIHDSGSLRPDELIERAHQLRIPLRFRYGMKEIGGTLYPQVWLLSWEKREPE